VSTQGVASPAYRGDFEVLAQRHLGDLLGSALRMTRNWEDAQDLTQDTLVRAFRGFASFQAGTNFKAWVFRIMVNTYINLRRKAARRPRTVSWEETPGETETGGFDPLGEEGQPEASTLAVLPNEHLKAALDDLPDEFRVPVLLCDVDEFSYKEIAHMLGIPLGTVRSRIFRGRQRLREALLRMGAVAAGASGAAVPWDGEPGDRAKVRDDGTSPQP
jgi:RNA polymerase sigma-70 factor (ECF subfamily)